MFPSSARVPRPAARTTTRPLARILAALTAAAVTFVGLVAVAAPAQADTRPAEGTPVTVAADSLPTVQVNGVVWQQAIAGNRVFAGGDFQNARPAGSAAGVNTVPRTNLLAYNLTTGELDAGWAPNPNAQVRAVAVSPDGTRVYVGGSFTTIAGQSRFRIAAFDAASGALLTSFNAGVDSQVRAIVATNTTVYVGGTFSSANNVARTNLAAFRASDGALLEWAPSVVDGNVSALTVSPDQTQVVIGGSFTTVNGSGTPGYGLARVDGTTGASLTLPVNNLIRTAGTQASITSLSSDADSFYGTGYVFGSTGNLEGTFKASWATGELVWVEDCHGDTYAAWPSETAVYVAGHPHYCGNVGGFPQTEPQWTFYRALAFSKNATQTVTNDPYGYFNFGGNPAPTLLDWYPDLNSGSYTGQGQGPWTVTGNSDYVLYAGEFTIVNNKGQQGLARFARTEIAPNKQGPRLGGTTWPLNVASFKQGTARISWGANYDRDNENLVYTLTRNGNSTPIHTVTAPSLVWKRPNMGFLDTGLTPGNTYTYRLRATDPFGNFAVTDQVSVTVASDGTVSPYAQKVLDDGASSFWRLGEPSGTNVYDWSGWSDQTAGSGVTRGAAGAVNGDTNTASTFDGTANGFAASQTPIPGPNVFTIEAWVKTTSNRGGKIVGFGNALTGTSGSYDRHVYMDNQGRIFFGVYPGAVRTVNGTTSYNDGQWHHVVATLGTDGMKLFVDGRRVGQRADTTFGQVYQGVWRIGGDSLGAWPNQPTSNFLAGSIDDVAIYPTTLTQPQVLAHYSASGRTAAVPAAPADAYGAAVYNAGPDLYWRLGETTGSTANDAGIGNVTGTYRGLVTKNQAGALSGVSNPSIRTLGISGSMVTSNVQFVGPSVYSEELWFNTTTTNGGKLIGFGDAQTGTSGGYDRHVYMETNGRLTFGTWTGVANTITSPLPYNNGQWHHMVATQGPDGMKLYVDGNLVGTNPQTGQQAFNGYWRIGGDTTWGPQPWFNGRLDEVAVYPSVLSAQTVANHYALGTSGQLPNELPTSSFTFGATDLEVNVDGTGSSDPDGTIASYAWTFGDGGTGTGSTASHTYAAGGTYTVGLTVTDNRGGTHTSSQQVTVIAPNQLPTAAFTSSATDLALSVDGAGSEDPDGTLESYAWDFGDGQTGTGATASHTYAAGGTYTVALTVTDDRGGTATVQHDVTVVPPNQLPTAAFTVDTTDLLVEVDGTGSEDPDGTLVSYAWDFGDGHTDTGATASYTYPAAGTYPVTLTVTDDRGGTATVSHDVTVAIEPPNQAPVAAFTPTVNGATVALDATASDDPDGSVVATAWTFGDGETGTGATTSHTYAESGTYTVTLTVTDDDGETDSVSHDVTVAVDPAFAVDTFARTFTNGWGPADLGGTWVVTGGAANFSVAGNAGVQRVGGAGWRVTSALPTLGRTDTDVTVKVSLDAAATGSGTDLELGGRTFGVASGFTSGYWVRAKVLSTGVVRASLISINGTTTTTLSQVNVPGLTYTAAPQQLQLRLQVVGTSPTTIRAKVWLAGAPEPASWLLTSTDATAALQAPGGVGLTTYTSSTTTVIPTWVRWSGLKAQPTAP